MYKIILLLLVYNSFPLLLSAQSDIQTNIVTSEGIFTVSKTVDGKDMILFSRLAWDRMQKGTKYTSTNIDEKDPCRFCMQLSGKEKFQCSAGIGFTCAVFDCPSRKKDCPVIVDHTNRICYVMVQKQADSAIKLVFLDQVDWESLQL